MKKLLVTLLIVNCSLLIAPSHAASPCAWVTSHPWKSNTNITSNSSYTCNPTCNTASSSADATWTVTITNGLGRTGSISGQSRCSANGTTNPPMADTSSNGEYCWCRATSIVDSTNNQICPADSNGALWVFGNYYYSADSCRQDCAYFCANSCVRSGAGNVCPRSALLTLTYLTCPSGSSLVNDDDYVVTCDNNCPSGYVKANDEFLIVGFEVTGCDDPKGTLDTMTCTVP
jgi:hypothetical protein